MYFDPSLGGMLIQVIVAIAAIGGSVVYGMRTRIRALFAKKDKKADAEEAGGAVSPAGSSAVSFDDDDDVVTVLDDEQ